LLVNNLEDLRQVVKERTVVVCVVGLGRVGLPLAVAFAYAGLKVVGIDTSKERVQSIRLGKSPFYDPLLQEKLARVANSQNFAVYDDINDDVDKVNAIILTVGTPMSANNRVDYNQLYSALQEITRINIKSKALIIRSTIPPRTMVDIIQPFLENKTGLKAGVDFALSVCPERILEGRAMIELYELPEIVGGVNVISSEITGELFRSINPEKEIMYTTPTAAELAKLFTNIYRYIMFALSNEFAIWAERYGEDAREIIKLANYNYPRSNIPIPGFAGGPCLTKDGIFLDSNTTFSSIVSTAWKLNESIPQHVVNSIKEVLGNLFDKRIAVLGLSFKANSDDVRDSPSAKLVEILRANGANVLVYDPYVPGIMPIEEVLNSPEIVILATNHRDFKDLAKKIDSSGCKYVYDVWGMFKRSDFANAVYLGLGVPK
jgi:UDP-N-acetyl-D-mannosaminuronic acid dehydrogenase